MRSSDGSTTSTAASTPHSAPRASCANSIEPGQSRKVSVPPSCSIVAALTSTLMPRSRASVEESPTMLPSPTLPLRPMAPLTKSRLSSNVVLPLPLAPTSATFRTDSPPAIAGSPRSWLRRPSRAPCRRACATVTKLSMSNKPPVDGNPKCEAMGEARGRARLKRRARAPSVAAAMPAPARAPARPRASAPRPRRSRP